MGSKASNYAIAIMLLDAALAVMLPLEPEEIRGRSCRHEFGWEVFAFTKICGQVHFRADKISFAGLWAFIDDLVEPGRLDGKVRGAGLQSHWDEDVLPLFAQELCLHFLGVCQKLEDHATGITNGESFTGLARYGVADSQTQGGCVEKHLLEAVDKELFELSEVHRLWQAC